MLSGCFEAASGTLYVDPSTFLIRTVPRTKQRRESFDQTPQENVECDQPKEPRSSVGSCRKRTLVSWLRRLGVEHA